MAIGMQNPIQWTTSVDVSADGHGVLTIKADVESGWHLYGMDINPEIGPQPLSIEFSTVSGVEFTDSIVASRDVVRTFDPMFEAELSWWDSSVTFTRSFDVVGERRDDYVIAGTIAFQGCNDEMCLPPTREEFEFRGASSVQQQASADDGAGRFDPSGNEWWQPVDVSLGEHGESSWLYIFVWGFLGGLLALLTPCVWPMIPLTVSFFLKKNTSRSESIKDAALYGAAIVVIYLAMGLIITALFGAGKLNELSTNAVFNLIFFTLLVVFAVSFFGAFDIKLPAKWSNAMDSRAESATGMLGIFFMAFTLVLVSFSCTGPIIGTLLVEAAAMGDMTGPAVGMGAFALALAIPFALFAIFPSWLKEMPRSGGWLNSVKVVLGFMELALSLKFLSVADLAYGWHILDREVFVSLWVVIFALLGFYLLGKVRFPHDSPVENVSVGRFFLSLVSLAFAVYLLPGLWGAPLKSVSAFVPPLYTQDFNLYAHGQTRHFSDFDEGMRYAAEIGRPVFIDFSGYGCVNCRKMEGAVFDTDEISSLIGDNFVMIELMVDDKRELARPFEVEENGKRVTVSTVGEKWSYLQRYKFGANTQPFYMILDNEGRALSPAAGYDEDVDKFADWLKAGLEQYQTSN